jgi:signal transduction histidine kinase
MANECRPQTGKIDSLKKICYSDLPADKKMNAFFVLMNQNESMSVEDFGKIVADAAPLVEQMNTAAFNCYYAYQKARYFTALRNIDSARFVLNNALKKYKDEPSAKHYILLIEFSLGRSKVHESKYKEAIEDLLPVLKKAEEENDKEVICRTSNNIGFCYMDMGRYEEAVRWFTKIIRLPLLPAEQLDTSPYYDNMGSCLNNMAQYDSAVFYINRGIEVANLWQNLTTLANALNIKADIFINQQKFRDAEPLLLKAIDIRKTIGDADYIASDMAQLSIFYANTKQFNKGIALANESLNLFKRNNLIAKSMFAYEALRTNYKNMGDDKNYALVVEKMLLLKDSLYTSNSAEALAEMQTKYEVQKKETLIAKQKLDLFQRNLFLYGGGIFMVLLFTYLFFRFKRYKQQQKINNTMAVKDAEENERKRIAAELHDNLGVQANAILHNSGLLNIEKDTNKHVVTDLQETAKEMLHNLRETLWAMKATDVTAKELWLRIINFMKQMGRHYTNINFKVEGLPPENFVIASNQALHIVLVFQESVNNSVKHANATAIIVASTHTTAGWQIQLTDNGKGFNVENEKRKPDSYGLSNMQQRAKEGNFSYHIESTMDMGTTITIRLNI